MINGYKEVFHILIAAFIIFGWLLSPVIHGPTCIGILAHWFLNKNRCVLSEGYEDSNGFSSGLLAKVGINIENNEFLKTLLPYILVSIPASISIYMALNNINICGDFACNIGKYVAPIVPIVITGSTLFKSFASGVQEGHQNMSKKSTTDTLIAEPVAEPVVSNAE